MIRRLALTIASLALIGMAAPAQAEEPVPMVKSFRDASREDREEMIDQAFQLGVLYNYCQDYVVLDPNMGRFITFFVAQGKGLTMTQAASLIDTMSGEIWANIPVKYEPRACAYGIKLEQQWKKATGGKPINFN